MCGLIAANHLPGMAIFLLLAGRAMGVAKSKPRALAALGLVVVLPMLLYDSLIGATLDNSFGIFWEDTKDVPSLLAHIRGGEYAQYQFLHAAPGYPFTLSTWSEFAAARVGQSFAVLDSQFGLAGLFVTGLALPALFFVGARRLWRRFRRDSRWHRRATDNVEARRTVAGLGGAPILRGRGRGPRPRGHRSASSGAHATRGRGHC